MDRIARDELERFKISTAKFFSDLLERIRWADEELLESRTSVEKHAVLVSRWLGPRASKWGRDRRVVLNTAERFEVKLQYLESFRATEFRFWLVHMLSWRRRLPSSRGLKILKREVQCKQRSLFDELAAIKMTTAPDSSDSTTATLSQEPPSSGGAKILRILKERGERLTLQQIMISLAEQGPESNRSEKPIRNCLNELVANKFIVKKNLAYRLDSLGGKWLEQHPPSRRDTASRS